MCVRLVYEYVSFNLNCRQVKNYRQALMRAIAEEAPIDIMEMPATQGNGENADSSEDEFDPFYIGEPEIYVF